jgi:uncharacterized membrane protein YccC
MNRVNANRQKWQDFTSSLFINDPTVRYIVKALLAAFLAIWVAMVLDLPQPKTAMTTVFIVMQPQSGMVLAKSFYRICGTIAGLIVMLAFIDLFAQTPILFVLSIALWVGFCTAGAARYRDFRSYGFLLAGYTPALIGFAAAQDPNTAFITATTRVLEIILGVVCSGVVSVVIFPEHVERSAFRVLETRYASVLDVLHRTLTKNIDRRHLESVAARFAADVVRFEGARSAAWFEGTATRARRTGFAQINAEFMEITTRLHAFCRVLLQLQDKQWDGVSERLLRLLEDISLQLPPSIPSSDSASALRAAAASLSRFQQPFSNRVADLRASLGNEARADLLAFDTGSEILQSLLQDVTSYMRTYASVMSNGPVEGGNRIAFFPKTSLLASGMAGARAMCVILLLSAFWRYSAWPSGIFAALTGGAVCALASTTPNPYRTARQMLVGAVLACCAALFLSFVVYPAISDLPLAFLALIPFLAWGVYASTQLKTIGIGIGFCIFVSFLAGPDNYTRSAPMPMLNECIALTISFVAVALAYAIVFPTSAAWLRDRLRRKLRYQVVQICRQESTTDPRRVRARFESATRDLTAQLTSLPDQAPAVARLSLDWALVVLEIGHPLLDLKNLRRRHASSFDRDEPLDAVFAAVEGFFSHPDIASHALALQAVQYAIAMHDEMPEDLAPHGDGPHSVPLSRRMVAALHFLRTVLIDAPKHPDGVIDR